MSEINWPKFKYHAQQQALLRSTAKLIAVDCGRGSGKTEIAKRKLVLALAEKHPWPDARYFYAAPTLIQAKRIAWDDFLKLIPKNWIDHVNISELKIKTIFGSELYVVGLDVPQRIEGRQYDGAVIDESSDIKPKTFELSVVPALTHRKGWCIRCGVPKRRGIGAKEFRDFCERISSGDLIGERYSWTTSEILDPEYINKMRNQLDPHDFQEQFEARWISSGGLVFYSFDRDQNVRKLNLDPSKPLLIGSDFNVDPMSWVIAQKTATGISVLDELFINNTNTIKTLDILHSKYGNHQSGFSFYPDASGNARKTSSNTTDIKLILNDKRFKANVISDRSNPPVASRFAATNALLCNANGQRNLHIDPCCKHLITDLESRYYKPGTNDPSDSGDLGHQTDALGYIVHKLFPIRIETNGKASVIIAGGRSY